jgi:hypothetical protein
MAIEQVQLWPEHDLNPIGFVDIAHEASRNEYDRNKQALPNISLIGKDKGSHWFKFSYNRLWYEMQHEYRFVRRYIQNNGIKTLILYHLGACLSFPPTDGEHYLNELRRLGIKHDCRIVVFLLTDYIKNIYEVDIDCEKLLAPRWWFENCKQGADLWIQNQEEIDVIPFDLKNGEWSLGNLVQP